MKYIVFSDSHGRSSFMERILEAEKFDGIIHLGDGYDDMDEIERQYWHKAIIRIKGNCDSYVPAEETVIPTVDGVTFLCTHGHRFDVKSGYGNLACSAKARGASVALFGHTHEKYLENMSGVLLVNPGTARTGEYAVIEFKNGKAEAELKEFE